MRWRRNQIVKKSFNMTKGDKVIVISLQEEGEIWEISGQIAYVCIPDCSNSKATMYTYDELSTVNELR